MDTQNSRLLFEETTEHLLDDKSRLIVPVRFREVLQKDGGDCVVITPGFGQKALYAHTLNRWDSLSNEVWSNRKTTPEMSRFSRHFIGRSKKCFLDKQGRIVIPPTLKETAELNKELMLIGLFDRFEIWSKANWQKEEQKILKEMNNEDMRNQISSLGL